MKEKMVSISNKILLKLKLIFFYLLDDKDMDVDNSDNETQNKPSSSKINPAAINSKKNSIDDSSSTGSSKLNVSDNQNSSNVKSESERTLNLNIPSTSALKDKDDMCNLNKSSVSNLTAAATTIVNVNNTSGSEIKTEIEIKEENDEAAGRSTINSVLPPHAVSKFGVS